MNIAVLLAGGVGSRLGHTIPKQFVEIAGKPLIVYCLEIYEASPLIDAVEVVCKPEYFDVIESYKNQYGFKKIKWLTRGGDSCQESTKNGIFALEGVCDEGDMLTLNMSTSVFVTDEILHDSFETAKKYGNAFCGMQCIYNMATTSDGVSSTALNYKETHKTVNMPWTAPFGTFLKLYKQAYEQDIETGPASYAPTLFLAMGETIYLSKDTSKNKLHVTTPEDLEIVTGCLVLDGRAKLDNKE